MKLSVREKIPQIMMVLFALQCYINTTNKIIKYYYFNSVLIMLHIFVMTPLYIYQCNSF